jgi:hypothetical protein
VQRKASSVESKSTTVDDAGFTMIAMIPIFKLTVWLIYMMFNDIYVRQMFVCVWIQLYYNQKLN